MPVAPMLAIGRAKTAIEARISTVTRETDGQRERSDIAILDPVRLLRSAQARLPCGPVGAKKPNFGSGRGREAFRDGGGHA